MSSIERFWVTVYTWHKKNLTINWFYLNIKINFKSWDDNIKNNNLKLKF